MQGRFWNRGAQPKAAAVMDWMEAESPAGVPVPQKQEPQNMGLGQRIVNARLDDLVLSGNAGQTFVGYVGTPNVMTTSTPGSITTPKVTYSTTAMSKSYSPATTLAK